MFKDLDYKLKAQVNNLEYKLGNKVEVTGTIVFIGHDEFASGGGVYTFMIRSDSTLIPAKVYYKKSLKDSDNMANPFNKGDIVKVTGRLRDNKYKDDDLEVVDKGKVLLVDPYGITYDDTYLDKLSKISIPEISFEQMINDNMVGITSETVIHYSKIELAALYRGIRLEVALNREIFKIYYKLNHRFNPGGVVFKSYKCNVDFDRYNELFGIYYNTML